MRSGARIAVAHATWSPSSLIASTPVSGWTPFSATGEAFRTSRTFRRKRRRGASERTRGLREARALLSRSKPSLPGRAVGPAVPDLPGFPQAAPEPHTPPQSYLWPRHIGVPCVSAGTPAHSSCRRERPSTVFGVFIVNRTGKSSATASVAAVEKRLRESADSPSGADTPTKPLARPPPPLARPQPAPPPGRSSCSRSLGICMLLSIAIIIITPPLHPISTRPQPIAKARGLADGTTGASHGS